MVEKKTEWRAYVLDTFSHKNTLTVGYIERPRFRSGEFSAKAARRTRWRMSVLSENSL